MIEDQAGDNLFLCFPFIRAVARPTLQITPFLVRPGTHTHTPPSKYGKQDDDARSGTLVHAAASSVHSKGFERVQNLYYTKKKDSEYCLNGRTDKVTCIGRFAAKSLPKYRHIGLDLYIFCNTL